MVLHYVLVELVKMLFLFLGLFEFLLASLPEFSLYIQLVLQLGFGLFDGLIAGVVFFDHFLDHVLLKKLHLLV